MINQLAANSGITSTALILHSQTINKVLRKKSLMIDASHGNSSKVPKNQVGVCENIAEQLAAGDARIMGVMVAWVGTTACKRLKHWPKACASAAWRRWHNC